MSAWALLAANCALLVVNSVVIVANLKLRHDLLIALRIARARNGAAK